MVLQTQAQPWAKLSPQSPVCLLDPLQCLWDQEEQDANGERPGVTLWLQLHLCPCCSILSCPQNLGVWGRPLPAHMQVPAGTPLVVMDKSWKQTLFSSWASAHWHNSMLCSFWDLYFLHKSHGPCSPSPPCSTRCAEKWRTQRSWKCKNSAGLKRQGSRCKKGADGDQDMGFLKHGHHSCLTAAVSVGWWLVPRWQHALPATGHCYFTRFGDPMLTKGKEARRDPRKVCGRPKKASMKSAGEGELIQQKLWIKRSCIVSSHRLGIFGFLQRLRSRSESLK